MGNRCSSLFGVRPSHITPKAERTLKGLLQEQHTALIATNPGESRVTCPFCQLQIPRNFFGVHVPFYHTQEPNCTGECPLCQETHSYLAVHIHDHFRSAEHTSGRLPIFALVVVRNAKGEYLLVDESASQGYWLPGGGVDPGEDFSAAAVREVKEETGVDVDLKGVLRVEFSPNSEHKRWPRMRVIFYAELKNTSPPPKTLPDFESAGACFAPHSMLKSLPLRSSEPLIWSQYLADGGEIYPLSIVARPHECPVVIHGKSPP
ncbi:NUDIX hydrolase domain-like protein [Phlyctochytrium arcticum]|nr:NUDIX hydrolase domain-like protein [Phlyctochytrium arcticum]